MNYPITEDLLTIIKEFAPHSDIQMETTQTTLRGNVYKSDYILIDKKNNVGFEVFENGIIVYYFSEHCHFDDESFSLEEDAPDYMVRAKELLKKLLTCTIRCEKTYRGKTLTKEQYILVNEDKSEECPAGVWVHSILIRLVPFLKKHTDMQSWKYDVQTGVFVEEKTDERIGGYS